MPTKKKTAYTLSRAKLSKKLDALVERLQEFEVYQSSFNDIETLVSDLEAELSDLAFEVTDTKA